MRRERDWVPIAIAAAVACAPIRRPPSPDAPVNVCPDHPCMIYALSGEAADSGKPQASAPAVCVNNACLASATSPPPQHLIFVVSVPLDSPLAPPETTTPGATYALPFSMLQAMASETGQSQQPTVSLTAQTPVEGLYWVQRSFSDNPPLGRFGQIGFFVGSGDVAIPAHVIYRLLWPPPGSSTGFDVDAAAVLPDAVELGLPIEPIQAGHRQADSNPYALASGTTSVTGPEGAPVLLFVASLQPGQLYERTIAPDPPFDVAFPPDVQRDSVASPLAQVQLVAETAPDGLLPHFFLTSAHGVEGWAMYLRDGTTKRPISPVQQLHDSTADAGVLLPTSHHPAPAAGSTLTNAELVIIPAIDSGLPTYVPSPQSLTVGQEYPLVPAPAWVTGRVDWPDAQASTAQVTFEATGIYAASPPPEPGDASVRADATSAAAMDAGTTYVLYTSGFEYSTATTALPDAGTSTYEALIPCGAYRVVVRPQPAEQAAAPADAATDAMQAAPPAAAAGAMPAVTVANYDTGSVCGEPPPELAIVPASRVHGTATVADGRPLSAATVEALPAHCPNLTDAGAGANDSPLCMPRYAWATTDAVGAFEIDLDPGGYVIRVEPLDGTRLPWVIQPLTVPPFEPLPLRITIPAPVYRGLQIVDSFGNAVANAVVRMFTLQGRGPAIEVGHAITNDQGRFDMYIDPAVE